MMNLMGNLATPVHFTCESVCIKREMIATTVNGQY